MPRTPKRRTQALRLMKEVQQLPLNDVEIQGRLNELAREAEMARLHAEERKDIIGLRKTWSKWVLILIYIIVFSQIALIFLMSAGWLQFPPEKVLIAFIIETLVQVLGLAYIIVNFLFGKDSLGSR